MAIEVGKRITKGLSEYIRLVTSEKERIEIANKHKYSASSAKRLSEGSMPVTKGSLQLVTDMFEKAIRNINNDSALKEIIKAHLIAAIK